MAERKNGPLVLAALICERVLEEKDGVLSVMRIVDRFLVPKGQTDAVPAAQFHYLAILKRGEESLSPGGHEAKARLRLPSGRETDLGIPLRVEWPTSEYGDEGVNLNLRLQLPLPEEGLYWIDLLLDGRLTATTPFRVFVSPASPPIGAVG